MVNYDHDITQEYKLKLRFSPLNIQISKALSFIAANRFLP